MVLSHSCIICMHDKEYNICKMAIPLVLTLLTLFVAFPSVLPEGATSPEWSVKLLIRYEHGANQVFESVLDGSSFTDFDSYLIDRGANTQAEANYDRVTYQELQFDILYDAPFLNIINETNFIGSTGSRSLTADCSPRLLGLSHVGSFVNVYVVCVETDNCQTYHELKVELFSTSYCGPGKGTWCKNPVGPLTLTTDVPCSQNLPHMAFVPLDTDVMILLDSYPNSQYLNCIRIQSGETSCKLGGVLPTNRSGIQYFYNESSQETLMQVQAEGQGFSQHRIDLFGSIHSLYSSNSYDQNPQCPMLNPGVFNCSVGWQFQNGSELIHLTDAIGEPQGFQTSSGSEGVAYVQLTGKVTAAIVVLPSLDGGRQVLDNSSWVCSNNARVKPLYVLKDGAYIVLTRCFPNGDVIFQVYHIKESCYQLVYSHQAMHLGSVQFGRVLDVLVIGQPFLVEGLPTVLAPGSPTTGTAIPSVNAIITISTSVVGGIVIVIVLAVLIVVVICLIRRCKRRKNRLCCPQGIVNGDCQMLLPGNHGDNNSLDEEEGGREVARKGNNGNVSVQAQQLEQDNKLRDDNNDPSRGQATAGDISDKLKSGDVSGNPDYSGQMALGSCAGEKVSFEFDKRSTAMSAVRWSAGREAASEEKTSISHSELPVALRGDADSVSTAVTLDRTPGITSTPAAAYMGRECQGNAPLDKEVCTGCGLPKTQRSVNTPLVCECGKPASPKNQSRPGREQGELAPREEPAADLIAGPPNLRNTGQEPDPITDSHAGSKTPVPSCVTTAENNTAQVVLPNKAAPDQGKSPSNSDAQEATNKEVKFPVQRDPVAVLSRWQQLNLTARGRLYVHRALSLPCNLGCIDDPVPIPNDRQQSNLTTAGRLYTHHRANTLPSNVEAEELQERNSAAVRAQTPPPNPSIPFTDRPPIPGANCPERQQVLQHPPSVMARQECDSQTIVTEEQGSIFAELAVGQKRLTSIHQLAPRQQTLGHGQTEET